MNAIVIRYQYNEPNPSKDTDLVKTLKQHYGGAVHFLAEGTIFLDTIESADEVFDTLSQQFTYDDKLFVGKLDHYKSLHHVTRVKPALHRIAS